MKLTEQQRNILLEKLASLEHERWMVWARYLLASEDISSSTRERWEKDFVSYEKLPEEMKQLDRKFAEKNLKVFEDFVDGM